MCVLLLAFGGTLLALLRFCAGSDLYSYVVLIPFVSGYLAWLQTPRFPAGRQPARLAAAGLLGGGLLVLAAAGRLAGPAPEDALTPRMLAFVLLLAGVCALFLGRERLRLLAFPLAFLVFMVPLPVAWRAQLDTFLQHGSAAAANAMFSLSGVAVLQDNLSFRLPGGIRFNVEPECSGIHSSLVLLITSLVAGHLLLRTRWKQALLVAVVLPLALLRNGFRIYVIGQLCVHYGARMFDSWVHHRGGPLFFAISLIPFFGLLLWLVKSEQTGRPPGQSPPATNVS